MGNYCDASMIDVKISFNNKVVFIGVEDTKSTTIKQIKYIAASKQYIPVDTIKLYFNQQQLTSINDNRTLDNINFKPKQHQFHMTVQKYQNNNYQNKGSPLKQLNINIRSIYFTYRIDNLNSKTGISSIKQIIQKKYNLPIRRQRLFYKAQLLSDNDKLEMYNITNQQTIHLTTILAP